MIDPKYPHYSKLKKYLTKEHLEIYKSLTQKFSYYDYFDNSQLNIIKNSRKSLVFSYKNLLIKVCFVRTSSSREIYFSHLFYPIEIFAFIVNDGCMLFLPLYSNDLNYYLKQNSLPEIYNNLEKDLFLQIINFHNNFAIHYDINPRNIVSTKNVEDDLYDWRIIDFGLMYTFLPSNSEPLSIQFIINSNLAKNRKDCGGFESEWPLEKKFQNFSEKSKLFWLYMIDWYDYIYILNLIKPCEYYVRLLKDTSLLITPPIINFIKELFKKYESHINQKPFYIMNVAKI
tara:strand:- start:78 stop:935 length:858 start_codon:yes stop_codon:yes gene_type:complete